MAARGVADAKRMAEVQAAGNGGPGSNGADGNGAGDGVLDDGAVAEFASEMSRSLEETPA